MSSRTTVVADEVIPPSGGRRGVVTRVAGETRYGTSAALAALAASRGLSTDEIWMAIGQSFPDGLVAVAAAGGAEAVRVLVDGDDPAGSPETTAWLAEHAGAVTRIDVAGGPAAVGEVVLTAAVQALRGG